MVLLLNLYLGHIIGDFLLQPGALVAAKRRGLPGLLFHVFIIGACTAVIVWDDLSVLWPIVLLAVGAHLLIEPITITARAKTQATGLGVFLIDQALHAISLVGLVWISGTRIDIEHMSTVGVHLEPAQLAFVCGLLAVMFAGSILVFECVRVLDPDVQDEILPYDLNRVGGMAERGVALALAVLVYAPLIVVPFIPRIAHAALGEAEHRERSLVEAATGLALCIAVFGLVIWVAGATR